MVSSITVLGKSYEISGAPRWVRFAISQRLDRWTADEFNFDEVAPKFDRLYVHNVASRHGVFLY